VLHGLIEARPRRYRAVSVKATGMAKPTRTKDELVDLILAAVKDSPDAFPEGFGLVLVATGGGGWDVEYDPPPGRRSRRCPDRIRQIKTRLRRKYDLAD
jgi:hypothetical protein